MDKLQNLLFIGGREGKQKDGEGVKGGHNTEEARGADNVSLLTTRYWHKGRAAA